MSALEIVLVVVLSVTIVVVTFYLAFVQANKRQRYSFFEVLNKTAKPGSTVFLGDSLTDFFPVQDFFPERLIYNRGIAGDQTTGVLKRLPNVIAIQPKKVFLQIGTNDLGHHKPLKQVTQKVITIIETLQKEVPGVEIIVISLYPVSHHKMWLSPLIAGVRSNKRIREVNKEIKAYCEEHDLIYVDLFSLLIDEKGRLAKDYTLEGLHISARGYDVISKTLKPLL